MKKKGEGPCNMPLQLLLQVLLPPTALVHTTPHACLNLLVPVHTALLSHLLVLVHTNPCARLNPLVPVHTPHTPLAPPHAYSYHPRAYSNPGTHPYLPHTPTLISVHPSCPPSFTFPCPHLHLRCSCRCHCCLPLPLLLPALVLVLCMYSCPWFVSVWYIVSIHIMMIFTYL